MEVRYSAKERLQIHQRNILRLILKYRKLGDTSMANKFEAHLSRYDALEDLVMRDAIADDKLNKLLRINEGRTAVMIAENVANQTETKKLTVLSKPEAAEIFGKDNIQIYFRQMLPPPSDPIVN